MTHGRRRTLLAAGSLALALLIIVVGCDDFLLSEQFYRDTGEPLAVSPAEVALHVSESVQFVASGGAPDYTYRVVNPGGGTIDPDTGVYVAPASAGDFEIEITDAAGNVTTGFIYVREPRPLEISPASASAVVGDLIQFSAIGGAGSYSFSVVDETVGTIDDPSSGEFTAQKEGSTDVLLYDGVNTVAASVSVYPNSTDLLIYVETPVVTQGGSTNVAATGGTTPYNNPTVQIGSLAYEDTVSGLGYIDWSVDSGTFTATNSIGVVELRVQDDTLVTDTVAVTVIPKAPTNLVVNGNTGSNSSIELTWEHASPLPTNQYSGFRIERATDSTPYVEVATVGPGGRSYIDETVSPSVKLYFYRIVAYAGTDTGAEVWNSRPSNVDFDGPKG